jgi:large subunit ribosomal protein L23
MASTDKKTKEVKEEKKPAKKTVAKKAVTKKEAPAKESAASMKELYSSESSAKKSSSSSKKAVLKSNYKGAYRVLEKPLVTEKAANLGALGQYGFVVADGANKIEVRKAVEAVYGVSVQGVNIIRMQGKRVSRGRIRGQRKDWKKAIVTLKKGDSIQLYEGV